jgi:hypothetical protein
MPVLSDVMYSSISSTSTPMSSILASSVDMRVLLSNQEIEGVHEYVVAERTDHLLLRIFGQQISNKFPHPKCKAFFVQSKIA